MPIKSRWSCDIPQCSLPTYIFTSSTHPLPKEPLYIDAFSPDTRYLTSHSHRSLALRIASGLIAVGLQTGDRVLLCSGNNIFFPAIFAGIIAAGGIFTGANPAFTSRELVYQLKDSEVNFLIVNEAGVDVGIDAARAAGMDPSKVFVFDDGLYMDKDGNIIRWEKRDKVKGVNHWSEIVEAGTDKFSWQELTTDEEVNRTAAINYSSGTTGAPKGVEITHRNFVSNSQQLEYVGHQTQNPITLPRWICFIPMYHSFGQNLYGILTPIRQVPTYMLPKYDFLTLLSCIQKFKITAIIGVPPIMVALAKHPGVAKYDLSSVVSLRCGAAPLGRDITRVVEEKVSAGRGLKENINLKQSWGMTETTFSVLGFHPDERCEEGSIGELYPNCEGKIMDAATGKTELPIGEEGEIWIRALNVMKGYYKNPKATRETLTEDGWLRTGDIGYYNKQGKWFIVDRKKDLIKVKGNQVAPAELEELLLEHPGLADAAVIGVPYAEDERPRAYVVVKPGVILTPENVEKWVQERVTRYKWLAGGVVFEKEIPRNPSGKILKKVLRERAKAEMIDLSDYKAKL